MYCINMSRYLIYFVYSILNIMIFSFFSISLYKIFCTSYDLDIFSLSDLSYSHLKYNSFFFFNCFSCQSVFYFKDSFIPLTLYIDINITCIANFLYNDFNCYSYYNIFQLYIFTKICSSYDYLSNSLYFYCLHDFIWIIPNETVLLFFRLWNNNNADFECVSIYITYPYESSLMLIKLQCFCFSSIFISRNELVELPVIFFFDAINLTILVKYIYIYYLLIPYNITIQ